jgi:hypothetical protein
MEHVRVGVGVRVGAGGVIRKQDVCGHCYVLNFL